MAFCKECGERIKDSNLKCENCGFSNPKYKELDDPFDLDTDTVVEGTYIMPGSPGHVSISGMKIISGGDDTPEGNVRVDEPIITPEAPNMLEVPTQTEGQDIIYAPEVKDEPIETEIPSVIIPESTYVSEGSVADEYIPSQPEETYILPMASSVNQGGYVPPTNNYGGEPVNAKKFGLPIPAIVGAVAVLIIAIFALMNMGGGKGDVAMELLGKWQAVALESEGVIMAYNRDDPESMYMEFQKDGKILFNPDTEPLAGSYTVDKNTVTLDTGEEGTMVGEFADGILTAQHPLLPTHPIQLRIGNTLECTQVIYVAIFEIATKSLSSVLPWTRLWHMLNWVSEQVF